MTFTTAQIKFFQLLKPKLGDNETEALVGYIDLQISANTERAYKVLATKEDVAKLETKIAETKTDTIRWVFSIFVVLMLAIVGLYFKK